MKDRVEQLCKDIGMGTAPSQEDHRDVVAQLYAADMVAQALLEQGKAIDRLTHLLSQSIRIRH